MMLLRLRVNGGALLNGSYEFGDDGTKYVTKGVLAIIKVEQNVMFLYSFSGDST